MVRDVQDVHLKRIDIGKSFVFDLYVNFLTYYWNFNGDIYLHSVEMYILSAV